MVIRFPSMINKTSPFAAARLFIVATLLSTCLSGCIFRDRSNDYQRAGSIKPISLPEGVSSVPLEPLYPIPEVREQTGTFYDMRTDGFVVPRPEQMGSEGEKAKVKIQKVGERRWILVDASTSQVWPLTQSFLSRIGVNVAQSVPATGLIQTDWVVFKSDPDTRSQFRIHIEKGLRPESTEIHVLQIQAPTDGEAPAWSDKSVNLERENWMIEELANTLAADVENKAASLLGQFVGGDIKAELFMDGAEPALRLRLQRARAWATLAHAVTREGFIYWDESSEQGVFYTQFIDETKKRNWFIRLFTFEPADRGTETPYKLADVLGHLAPSPEVSALFGNLPGAAFAEPLEDAYGYLVILYPDGDDFIVKVRNVRGERIHLADNKRMLTIIRRNLI